jgi:hypothetical protein
MIDASRVLTGLPTSLRDELLESYQEVMSNYLERRWEPSELNGGKFCEVVYSIINGALQGTFPAKASKPANMLTACQVLGQVPSNPGRVGDRSLHVLIPRVLPMLYEIRNNRGVGHVGGDVDANHMDAEAIQAMAGWVMAELIRIFHGVPTSEAQETVDALVERKSPLIWEVKGTKRVLDPKMTAKDQVLVILHHSDAWVPIADLFNAVEYSTVGAFTTNVLRPLHKKRHIELDAVERRAMISPLGIKEVEQRILPKH